MNELLIQKEAKNNLIIKKIGTSYRLYSANYFQEDILVEGEKKTVYKRDNEGHYNGYYYKVEVSNVVGNKDRKVIRFYDTEPNKHNRHLVSLGNWIYLRHAWELEPTENKKNKWETWIPSSYLKTIANNF